MEVRSRRLKPAISLRNIGTALFLGSLLIWGPGCSSQRTSSDGSVTSDGTPPAPDAGTDAVPQAAVEDRSSNSATTQAASPGADAPPVAPDAPPVAPETPEVASAAQADPPAPLEAPAAQTAEAPVPSNEKVAPSTIAEPARASSSDSAADSSAGAGVYTTRAGDTLMKIAFENYGNLYKWREIYEANRDRIADPNALSPGIELKLDRSVGAVTIEKNGNQYLIKRGDTLGTISDDVYGTNKKWKKLWENNKQLIHDPNKIYAGFYLFYTLTPEERVDFKRRKGSEPEEPVTTPKPLAEKAEPAAEANREVSSEKPAASAPAPNQAAAVSGPEKKVLPPVPALIPTGTVSQGLLEQPAPQAEAPGSPQAPPAPPTEQAPATPAVAAGQ